MNRHATHMILAVVLLTPFLSKGSLGDVTGGPEVPAEVHAELDYKHPDNMSLDEMKDYFEIMEAMGKNKGERQGSQQYVSKSGVESGTQIKVSVACDPNDGRFYMNVYEDGERTHRWLTSPGTKQTPTLPFKNQKPHKMTEMWITSEHTDYPGIEMPHTIWLKKWTGYAIHGSDQVKYLGYPASHGCLRLSNKNAKTLYNKVAATGFDNVQVSVKLNYDCDRPTGWLSNWASDVFGNSTGSRQPQPQRRQRKRTQNKKWMKDAFGDF